MGFPICRWIVETFQVLLGVLFYPFLSNESLYLSSSEREKFRTYEEDVDLVDVKKRHYDRPMFYSRHIPNQETSSTQIANQNNAIQTSLPRPFTDQDQTRFRKGSQPGIQTFASIKASPEPRHRKQFHGNEAKSIFQDTRQTEPTSEKVKEFGIKGSQPLVMLDRLSILSVAKREASLPQSQAPEADHSMKFSLAKPSNVPAESLTPSSQKSIIPPNALLPIINYNEITYVQQIGTGGFGQVWKGIWKGTPVAVKMLNPACQASNVSEKILLSFEEEVCMLARLRHPNICLLLGVCMEASHRLIVTELVSRGSLWDALRTPGLFQSDGKFFWPVWAVKKVIEGAGRGLIYLHSHDPPIIHRDFKSPNLLLDDSFNVKICDFGLAKLRDLTTILTANVGTVQWMAPEVLTGNSYTESADIYSLGLVLWEMLTGQCPYDGMKQVEIALAVVNNQARPPIPVKCAPELANFLQKSWATDPRLRPSAEQFVAEVGRLLV